MIINSRAVSNSLNNPRCVCAEQTHPTSLTNCPGIVLHGRRVAPPSPSPRHWRTACGVRESNPARRQQRETFCHHIMDHKTNCINILCILCATHVSIDIISDLSPLPPPASPAEGRQHLPQLISLEMVSSARGICGHMRRSISGTGICIGKP